MSSGTRVPRPRTWRTIGPRLTVSTQTVERSTLGTAGFKRAVRFSVEIIAADVAQRLGPLDAWRARSVENRRVVMTIDEWKLARVRLGIWQWFHFLLAPIVRGVRHIHWIQKFSCKATN